MRSLRSLDIGNQFRVAHPTQRSKNNLPMDRELLYTVVKIFPMSPEMRVCRTVDDPRNYTLLPETPILGKREPLPTIEEVERFLLGPEARKIAVGYRLIYNGEGREFLESRAAKKSARLIEFLYVTGIREFSTEKMRELLNKSRIDPRFKDYSILRRYAGQLHLAGLIEVLYDDEPGQVVSKTEVFGAA